MPRTNISRKFFSSERGAIAVMFGLTMPAIIGFGALGTEVGYWQVKQRQLQNAADAAAYSAAAQMAQGRGTAAATTAAAEATARSGFTLTPSVSAPPTMGAFAGDTDAVEVGMTLSIEPMFTSLFRDEPVQIRARAVARAAGKRPSCVLALNPSAGGAVSFSGSAEVKLSGCDIASNSLAHDAMDFSGSTEVVADCVSAAGGLDGEVGKLTLTDCAHAFENARVAPDPFADRTLPVTGWCDPTYEAQFESTTATIDPGTICQMGTSGNSITIHGSITLNPGTYIFDGVDLNVNAGATLEGQYVTLVFKHGGSIDINGNATIKLSAPMAAADPMRGIVLFGDPADTTVLHKLNGSSAEAFQGAIYFPGSDVQYSGGTASNPVVCTLLIADEIEFTGNSYFGSNCALGPTTPETAQVVLIVE